MMQSAVLRECFASDATDPKSPEATKFSNSRRPDQTMDVYLMEFEVLREKAGARMVMGGGFPDEFVSFLCKQNASISKIW